MVEVSVIIINYNTYELTRNAIRSIQKFVKTRSYEIIVVDNSSDVDSIPLLVAEFPDIVPVNSTENCGFAKGNNLGIERSEGKYILLLNSDAELLNDTVEICANYLDQNQDTGVVTCRLEYPDGRVQHNCQRFPGGKYTLIELLRIQKLLGIRQKGKLLLGSFFQYDKEVSPDWVWGTYFFFRAEILKTLPDRKLNDEYFMYGEDMQWCWDIRKLGWKIVFLPMGRVRHIMGGSSGDKGKWMRENYSYFLRKNYTKLQRNLSYWMDSLLG